MKRSLPPLMIPIVYLCSESFFGELCKFTNYQKEKPGGKRKDGNLIALVSFMNYEL